MGLYLFTKLTQAHLETSYRVRVVSDWIQMDSIIQEDKNKKTFLFVGNNFGLKNYEMDTILSNVKDGSTLFLAFNDLTENLYEKLFTSYALQYEYNDHVNVFTKKHKYKMINLYQNDTIATEWKAFKNVKSLGKETPLSSFMEMTNFLKVKYGKGYLYFHSNPEMFFNYQLKRLNGYKYSEFVLNHLSKEQDVYLLELGRLSDRYGEDEDEEGAGDEGKKDDSYFKLIFQDPMLLTALLLSIIGVVLFVIFRSRRTQPIVPYIPPKKDMTLAFTETITSIYFAKRNPYGLLQVQRKNFYAAIQKKFFLDLNRRSDEKVLDVLSEKSNIPRKEIDELINSLETKEAFSVSEQFITDVSKKMYSFYTQTGIVSDKLNQRISSREMVFRRSLILPSLFVLGGIITIITGLYFLMSSIGVGIVFWPIGILLITLGSIRLSRPYLIIKENKLTVFGQFGQRKEFDTEEIITTKIKESGVVLIFNNNRKIIINYWDLSRFDKAQFKRYVSKLHNLDI